MSDGACDFDDPAHGRNWILTRLNPPVTVELCDEHLAPGMIGLLAADLGVEYADLYTAIEKFLAREAKKAEKDLAAAQAAEAEQGEPLYNHVECAYCGNYLDDGESHLHGGAPNPGDAEVPA